MSSGYFATIGSNLPETSTGHRLVVFDILLQVRFSPIPMLHLLNIEGHRRCFYIIPEKQMIFYLWSPIPYKTLLLRLSFQVAGSLKLRGSCYKNLFFSISG
jgi:hypothetical protein